MNSSTCNSKVSIFNSVRSNVHRMLLHLQTMHQHCKSISLSLKTFTNKLLVSLEISVAKYLHNKLTLLRKNMTFNLNTISFFHLSYTNALHIMWRIYSYKCLLFAYAVCKALKRQYSFNSKFVHWLNSSYPIQYLIIYSVDLFPVFLKIVQYLLIWRWLNSHRFHSKIVLFFFHSWVRILCNGLESFTFEPNYFYLVNFG